MKPKTILAVLVFLLVANLSADAQQYQSQSQPQTQPQSQSLTPQQQVSRDATREKLRAVLGAFGPKINVSFRQSDKEPYNFVGIVSQGLKNAGSFEIVISVTAQESIHFRIYPHYAGRYVNIDKVRNGSGLMRQMVQLSDKNFLYWGADGPGDIFAGYNFTLESGFPEASIRVVLNSIALLDQFLGQMRPAIDGSSAP